MSYTNPTTWLKYAEMEMRHRFVNHARNVWDRAVSLLPRVDQLWCSSLLCAPRPTLKRCHQSQEPSSPGSCIVLLALSVRLQPLSPS